ncbi:MAG: hypothetical protein WCL00_08370, partial [Bacteroidota bacterium]
AGHIVELESIGTDITVNNLVLTDGTLDLTGVPFTVLDSYSHSSGILKVDGGTSITIGGTYATGQVLDFDGTSTLNKLQFNTTNSLANAFTIPDALTAAEFTVGPGGSVITERALNAGSLANNGNLKIGGTTIVSGTFTMNNAAALFDFRGQSLELQGAINNLDGNFSTDNLSTLLLTTAVTAWDLHSSITVLKDLTIGRSLGVTMTANLSVDGTLNITSGNFNINGKTLTIKDLSGTNANLKGTSLSSLIINQGNDPVILGGLLSIRNLTVNTSHGVTIGAAVTNVNSLTLTQGAVTGANNLSLLDNATITRTAGSIDAVPGFGDPVNILYNGTANSSGPELPALGSGFTADVTVNTATGVSMDANSLIRNLTLTSGNFTIGALTLELTGNLTDNANQLVGSSASILVLNGANAFTIPGYMNDLGDLTANRTNGVSMNGNLEVHGGLNLDGALGAGPGFAVGANILKLNNAITGTPTKLKADGTSSITIAGTSAGIIVPSSVTALNNLTLNNTNGTSLQANLDLTSLTLTDGILVPGNYNLSTLGATGGSQSAFVYAAYSQSGRFTVKNVQSTKLIPVGYKNENGFYTPLNISNSDESDFTVAIEGISLMSQFVYPVPSPKYVKLQWDIARANPNSGTATVNFNWNAAEGYLEAPAVAGGNENAIPAVPWQDAGTIEAIPVPTATSITVSGITQFSKFALYGNKISPVYVDAVHGDDNNTGENPAAGLDGPKKTLFEGINVVATDGTINVAEGTYTEDVLIPATKGALDITGYLGGTKTIVGVSKVVSTSFPLASPNIEIRGSGTKIHGFTIKNPANALGYYSSGMVIGATNVEIYNNAFMVAGSANTEDISQGIQTIAATNISGLNIHNNTFTHLASSVAGYEGIYINSNSGIGTITIDQNDFSGEILRGITTEASKTTISNNNIITDLAASFPGGWEGINLSYPAGNGTVADVAVSGNTVKGSTGAFGFQYGVVVGNSANTNTFTNIDLTGNTIQGNEVGVRVREDAGQVTLTGNKIMSNSLYGVKNEDPSATALDALRNWWGSPTGPEVATNSPCGAGDKITANVSYEPWYDDASFTHEVYKLVDYVVSGDKSICVGGNADIKLASAQNGSNYEYT